MRNAVVFLLSAVLLLLAGSAWIALYPAVPEDLGGVDNLDGRAQAVRIPVGEDDHVDGWWLRGAHPATVLLLAGYARDHRRMWRYAQFLHRQGLTVLTVDFRSARQKGRKPTTLGYWELHDARATLDWLRKRPGMGGVRVGLFGESLGGSVALALAAERADVAAVVADCPFATGEMAIADGFRCVLRLPPSPLAQIARQMGRLVTGHDPGALDVTQALRTLSARPVLLVQTRLGDRFSPTQVDRLNAALGRGGESWTVDDVKHTQAWLVHRGEYELRVGRFLSTHLGLAPTGLAPRSAPGPRKGGAPIRTAAHEVAQPLEKKRP